MPARYDFRRVIPSSDRIRVCDRSVVEKILGARSIRVIPSIRETSVHRWNNGAIAVYYQGTAVVTYNPNGTVTLRSGGWETATTKQRINDFSPFSVYQRDYTWYVATSAGVVRFYNGITLDPATGEVVQDRAA